MAPAWVCPNRARSRPRSILVPVLLPPFPRPRAPARGRDLGRSRVPSATLPQSPRPERGVGHAAPGRGCHTLAVVQPTAIAGKHAGGVFLSRSADSLLWRASARDGRAALPASPPSTVASPLKIASLTLMASGDEHLAPPSLPPVRKGVACGSPKVPLRWHGVSGGTAGAASTSRQSQLQKMACRPLGHPAPPSWVSALRGSPSSETSLRGAFDALPSLGRRATHLATERKTETAGGRRWGGGKCRHWLPSWNSLMCQAHQGSL